MNHFDKTSISMLSTPCEFNECRQMKQTGYMLSQNPTYIHTYCPLAISCTPLRKHVAGFCCFSLLKFLKSKGKYLLYTSPRYLKEPQVSAATIQRKAQLKMLSQVEKRSRQRPLSNRRHTPQPRKPAWKSSNSPGYWLIDQIVGKQKGRHST